VPGEALAEPGTGNPSFLQEVFVLTDARIKSGRDERVPSPLVTTKGCGR
jgi:hypothetical protein